MKEGRNSFGDLLLVSVSLAALFKGRRGRRGGGEKKRKRRRRGDFFICIKKKQRGYIYKA